MKGQSKAKGSLIVLKYYSMCTLMSIICSILNVVDDVELFYEDIDERQNNQLKRL
jgi:hypothetical protein